MRKQQKKKKGTIVGPLPLTSEEWEIEVDIGKSFLHNPTNARSSVYIRVKHIPSGRVGEVRRKGCFTKAAASKLADELISSEQARLLKK